MKKILVAIAIIIVVLINKKEENIIIPDSAIRFRIVANSNSLDDQTLKNNLEKEFSSYLYTLINNKNNKEQIKSILLNNINNMNSFVDNYKVINNKNFEYNINIGNNYFPSKYYKGIKYDAGYYDSIVLTLGHGSGLNWWCIIYPPLCLIDEDKTDVEYTSIVKELLNKADL